MKIPLIFICTITLLQIPSYATSGIFGDDEKIEELNKKIDVLEKANKEQSVDINSLRLDVKKLNEQLNKNNKELLEADVRSNLAIMELDCVLGRQMILVEFGFALNRITLSSLSTPQSL